MMSSHVTRLTRAAAVAALALAAHAPALRAQKEAIKGAAYPDSATMWAAQTSPTQIQLAWAHVLGAVRYDVLCAIGDLAPRLLGSISAPGTLVDRVTGGAVRMSYIVVLRNSPTLHKCSLRAVDAKGLVSSGVPFNPVMPVEKSALSPVAPATVTASETGPGEITVTWSEVPGATGYVIGRAVAPGGLQALCALCPAKTTYVDRAIKTTAKHTYSVAAMTPQGAFPRTMSNGVTPGSGSTVASGGGGTSGGGSPTTDSTTANPKGPSSVTATLTGPTTATVYFPPVSGVIGFRVTRVVNGVAKLIGTIAPIVALIPGVGQVISLVDNFASELMTGVGGTLATSTQKLSVEYKVEAIYSTTDPAKGLAPAVTSNVLSVDPKAATSGGTTTTTTTTVIYAPPSNAKAVATSATSVTLSWTPAAGVTQCRIERSTNGGAYATLATLSATTSSHVDAAANVPTFAPRYRIACADPKGLAHPPVAFTVPVWNPKGTAP